MDKIASPQDLQAELRRLLAYSQSEKPSREKIAGELRALADRVADDELTEKTLVEYLKESGSSVTVFQLTYAFGGNYQKHTRFLEGLINKGVLKRSGKQYSLV
jgi:hypothetical protein